MKLVLFDVDGTLIRCGPQVRPIFAAALREVFGRTGDLDGYSFAGKTDPRIVLDLMTGAGLAADEVERRLPRMREDYLRRLEAALRPERVELLPGVVALLERLVASPRVAVGLLTGNWHPGARHKLASHDLNRFFTFGAFGDDGVQRHELPPVALERARQATGREFRARDVLIVGDSVEDVKCALAHGLRCLAVGTGWTPPQDLHGAGACWVAEDLPGAVAALEEFGVGTGEP